MRCSQCGFENRATVRFCEECGVKLELRCSACGTTVPVGRKFCGGCGQSLSTADTPAPRFAAPDAYTPRHLAGKILTSKAALEGERKQVTVLFADLKGSMELFADRDPEDARKILDPVLELMMEAVHRYEGTVNQVMGDGIMALFGAPLAHEDHAVRACYAALRMQEAVRRYSDDLRRAQGVEVQIRVGVNSGDVVVRSIGSDLRMDYTAVGQTVHLAARMEQLAAPGSIRLTAGTLHLAESFVQVTPLGPVPIKGLDEPLDVFELVGAGAARTRLEAAARRGLTRFFGRNAELEQLCGALDRASLGHGQVVAVVGEPGVGKSRLFWELTHSHRVQGWLILEATSVSYGKATAYLPVIELLRGYFGIESRDDPRKIREKVTGKVLTLAPALGPAVPAFLALLDVPVDEASWHALDPPQRRQQTLDAVKRLLLRESEAQPLMVIFEDLHWIDGETQALLDSLIESLPAARLLLLVNYRPEYQHAWGGKTYYRQFRIDPLPPESADELLDALLGPDVVLRPLKQLLVERTEANPLFLEENVRALVETAVLAGERGAYRLTRPVESLKIPATVQVILAARIDRLGPEAKRLLQAAAVIGKDVPMPLLLAIADAPEREVRVELTHLQAAEFLYETRLFPDLEYTFKHALTHEVAYGALLHDKRRALHARIVNAIETLHRDRLGEHLERLAHHARDGELREKAVHYLRQAGLKAFNRWALAEARRWFEQALGVLEALPESRSVLEQAFDVRLELRPALNQLGEARQVLQRLGEAESLADRLNDDHKRGSVCVFMTVIHMQLGELEKALAIGTRALDIAVRRGDLRLRIPATSVLVTTHYERGDYERVVELATGNLQALPADWVHERFGRSAPASVYDRCWLGLSLGELGRFAEAAACLEEAIRLAELTQHAYTVGSAYRAAGMLELVKGDWARARSLLQHAIAAFRTGNIVLLLPSTVSASAWVLAQLGEATEALNRLQEGEEFLGRQASSGTVGGQGWANRSMGRACLLLGRLDEARRIGEAVVSSRDHHGFLAHALSLLGDLATHPDQFDAQRGEAHYRRALSLAEPRGMRPLVAHCHLGLGKLYRRTGKRQEAQQHLTTATTMYRDMDMRFWREQAEAEIGRLQ
jgi:class 3 adenylate cyclase/tetratricopeptide (TPR) repeat protein